MNKWYNIDILKCDKPIYVVIGKRNNDKNVKVV